MGVQYRTNTVSEGLGSQDTVLPYSPATEFCLAALSVEGERVRALTEKR